MIVHDLRNWCIFNSPILGMEDMDKSFVVDHFFKDDTFASPVPTFHIMVATRRLLALSTQSTMWHVDATYKLTWQAYPFFIGVTDAARHFLLPGL